MRKPVSTAPEIITRRSDPTIVEQVRHYSVITPLYGGGVKPAQADPVSIVRGTEIRGHLRFWWRATRGGIADGNPSRLREEEGKIWGTAAGEGKPGPSQVQITVKVDGTPQPRSMHEINQKYKVDYATFPLREAKDARMRDTRLLEEVKFQLVLRYPKEKATDVEAALWAWETFGGIGARTRRGFGALHCTAIDNKKQTPPSS